MTNRAFDAAVVGGGPAGMLAAITAAERGRRVVLVEKNDRLGRKLRITGKGRCNVTNNCEPRTVIESAPGNGRFLYGAVQAFPPEETMRFFESLGVPLKVERGNRVFPVSDSAHDIADALARRLKELGVPVVRGAVRAVRVENGAAAGVEPDRGEVFGAPSVLLACGGASYPGTGSNGDGARLAKALGHTVEPLRPSLVALESPDPDCPAMQGLSLRNCGVGVWERGKKKPVYTDFGELRFPHFGLSGPTILSASAHMRRMEPGRYAVEIDLKPALDDAQLDQRLLRDLEKNKNRNFCNALGELLPQKMIPVIVRRSGIPPEEKCNAVTREQRAALREVLRRFRVEISGFGPLSGAIVTAGGVSVREIDPKTMQSKLVPGLYFAGEIIDVDAYTGGFNLQIAFSTGYAAGSNL